MTREEVVESGNLTYGIRTYSFWPFDFNQGYFNQFEVLESQKWPLVDKTKSFYIKSALSFSDFQLLYGQKTVYSLQPLLFLEIIALNLRLCISFSVLITNFLFLVLKLKVWWKKFLRSLFVLLLYTLKNVLHRMSMTIWSTYHFFPSTFPTI